MNDKRLFLCYKFSFDRTGSYAQTFTISITSEELPTAPEGLYVTGGSGTNSDPFAFGLEKPVTNSILAANSLSLDGSIGVNFYCKLDDAVTKVVLSGPNEDVTLTGKALENCIITKDGTYKGYHKLTYRVYSDQMHEKVSIKLYDASGKEITLYKPDNTVLPDDYGYSVFDYKQIKITDSMSDSDKDYYEKVNALVAAMNMLGEAAENQFDDKSYTIEDNGITAENVPAESQLQLKGIQPVDHSQ